MFQVNLSKTSKKELNKLNSKDQSRIINVLEKLSSNPYLGKKLKGPLREYYSYKVWPFRIIYSVKKKALIVLIVRIGHRKNVYE